MSGVEQRFGGLARDLERTKVDKHHVAFSVAGNDAQAALDELFGHGSGVLHHLLAVDLEGRVKGFAEGHGLGGDDVHERTALHAREDGGVDLLLKVGTAEDEAAARTAERLVRGRRHDVGVAERGRVDAGGDEARIVGHVDHQVGADGVGDFGKALEVDAKRVGGGAGDDDLRLAFPGELFNAVVVDRLVGVKTVGNDLEVAAGIVEVHAVRQMAAFGKREAHDRVADLEKAEVHGGVGLSAGVGLHVDGHLDACGLAEELLGAVDGELFNDVDVLAAAVVALAGIAFRVLVREAGPLGLHDRRGSVVFARDELNVVFLTGGLVADDVPDGGIDGLNGIGALEHDFSSFSKTAADAAGG